MKRVLVVGDPDFIKTVCDALRERGMDMQAEWIESPHSTAWAIEKTVKRDEYWARSEERWRRPRDGNDQASAWSVGDVVDLQPIEWRTFAPPPAVVERIATERIASAIREMPYDEFERLRLDVRRMGRRHGKSQLMLEAVAAMVRR